MARRGGLRLDERLVRDGLAASVAKAKALVMSGQVIVGEHRHDKAGSRVADAVPVRLKRAKRHYVSRGGDKLEGALATLCIDVRGWRCLDVGASTGGFTDCLLHHGAAAVCALDVGYGIIDGALRNDDRVILMERCNARHLRPEQLPWCPDLVTIDVSFVSIVALLDALVAICGAETAILAMVKPQFELPRERVPRGGVVRNEDDRQAAAQSVIAAAHVHGFGVVGRCDSELTGPAGNRELFVHLKRRGEK